MDFQLPRLHVWLKDGKWCLKGSQADPPCPPQKTELWTQLTMTRNGFLGGSVTQDSSKLKSTKIRSSLCSRKTETGQIHTISIYASIYTGCIHTHTHTYIYICVRVFLWDLWGFGALTSTNDNACVSMEFDWPMLSTRAAPAVLSKFQSFSTNRVDRRQPGWAHIRWSPRP